MGTTNLTPRRSAVTASQYVLDSSSIQLDPGTKGDLEGSQEGGSPVCCLQLDFRRADFRLARV